MGPELDPVGRLFASLAAMTQAERAKSARLREARRNSPEMKQRRADAAARGWQTRRAREAEEARQDALTHLAERPSRPGPRCGELNHNSVGREVFCELDPDHEKHDEPNCDDDNGTTWLCERD